MPKNDSGPKKRAVYLNEAESRLLADRVDELKKAGSKAGQATVIRALMHVVPSDEMFASSVKMIAAEALGQLPVTKPGVYKFPTIDVTGAEWEKIGGVVERLATKGMTATHNLVLRALVGNAPKGATLRALVDQFKREVPNKPRGLPKLRLEGKA